MVKQIDKNEARLRRHRRVRNKISGTAARPRLDVFRSAKHIYAQIIDDEQGVTLVSALLMVSRIRFWSFKGSGERGPRADRVPFLALAVVPIGIAFMVIDLPRVLFAVGVVYALSGPCYWVWQRTRKTVEPNA